MAGIPFVLLSRLCDPECSNPARQIWATWAAETGATSLCFRKPCPQALNSLQLHKRLGTGFQVADGIHLAANRKPCPQALNSLQLHKRLGTGFQVADGIHLAAKFGHCKWTARYCLNVPNYSQTRNRNCMHFTGQSIHKFKQIGKDGDVVDTGWPSRRYLSLAVLNQRQFLSLEITFRNIRLYVIVEVPISKDKI